jgi:hypothetical protein
MLELGVVRPIQSDWSCPCFLAPTKKDDGTWVRERFVIDVRGLNTITKKVSYPSVRMEDILNKLRNSKYFSNLDFSAGYWQIPMTEEAQRKSTFICREGTFAFTVMPFGLANAPRTFIKLLDTILAQLDYDTCLAYVDDLILWSATEEEHLLKIEKLFKVLEHENLKLQPKKCSFMFNELTILGVLINAEGVSPDPQKLTGVSRLRSPRTTREAKRIYGLLSYFRKFIPKFSQISRPIQLLTSPSVRFHWTEEANLALETLKKLITSRPILAHFDPAKEAILKTDASLHGLGGAIFQVHNGVEKPCAFISRTLSPAEANYPTMQLELTAIAWCLNKLRSMIYGVPIKIYTDNCAACFILKSYKKQLSPKLSRIALTMMEYDIVGIHHVSGAKHDLIDCLSRFPTEEYCSEEDEIEDVPLLAIEVLDFATSQRTDAACNEIIVGLSNPALSRLKVNFLIKDDVLYYRHAKQDRNVVVVPQSLQQAILHECHDSPMAAHLGIAKTFERIRRSYWWPQMRKDIVKYVRTCHPCQVRKIQKQKPSGLMQFFEIPEEIFSRVQIDVAGPFPTSSRQNKLIITATDYVSKWLESRAV